MINFDVPRAMGFGVARGPACCLVSGDVVLDYSGHLLNLTSRLTDLARPSGILIDGQFGLDLLPDDQQERFESAEVYLRSVAEDTPRTVYVLKDVVELSEASRRPLRLEQWERIEEGKTVREWGQATPRYGVDLEKKLKRDDGIQVQMVYPAFKGGKRLPGLLTYSPAEFHYALRANRPEVVLHVDSMVAYLRKNGVPWAATANVIIDYVPE